MGGKNKAPKPPDYTAIAEASERASELSFQLGQEQLAWAREQYGRDSEIIRRVVDDALQRAATNDENAATDRARYERIYQPLENQLAREAQDYATPERQEFEAGRAAGEVSQQFDGARRAAMQNLESFGVDPSSTRYAALDLGSRVAQAAAQAGAANQARTQAENTGRVLRSEAINVGRGYPGQIAGTYATANQSGGLAANSQLANTSTGASTMGTGVQWQGIGNQALNTWGNVLNQGYQNQLAQYNANQQSSSGIGSLLGAGLAAFFEDGGAVPEEATSGGNVPVQASPSRGAAIDDVPARLNAGEFVVPKEAVSWFGERHFQKMIEQAKNERVQAPAKPKYALAPAERPAFTSAPKGALPV